MPGEFPEGGQPPRVLFVSWTPPSEGHIASDVVLWELLLHVLGASRFPSEEQRCLNSFVCCGLMRVTTPRPLRSLSSLIGRSKLRPSGIEPATLQTGSRGLNHQTIHAPPQPLAHTLLINQSIIGGKRVALHLSKPI